MERIEPVTAERLDDLADLFGSNRTAGECWCMFFIATRAEFDSGCGDGGNRREFERLAQDADPPMGLLAYADGTPVGWAAVGPRSRYPRTIGPRAVILRNRDPAEDEEVWLVPCFFVRHGHRGRGTPAALLRAAVEMARQHGARAVEGFPVVGEIRSPADGYLGREKLFADAGFVCVARPTPRRAVMRLDLHGTNIPAPPSSTP